jgi:hypothetical protein
MEKDAQWRLVMDFTHHFLAGGSFATITEARKQAASLLNEPVNPGTALAKQVDEAVEAGVVRAARGIIQTSTTTHEAYDRLVDLHARQPALNVRSSTSVLQQAYSTPIPIAFLAATLAGITPDTTVYEPAAGHGALLVGTDPIQVTVNELNPDRAADLRAQGYTVTEWDAAEYQPERQHDVVIANPPFGAVRDAHGQRKRFRLPGNLRGTNQIDQAISFQALGAMRDSGHAVLILGGKLGIDEELRSERYNTLESRGFFYALYQQYAVTQHISIWGDLYRKQGAGFPIDLIVIEGRGRSERPLPAADVPIIYNSFAELKELIPNEPIRHARFTLDVPVHEQSVPQLSQPLDAGESGAAVHRQGAASARAAERNDLSGVDADPVGRNDSGLGSRHVSRGGSATAGQHPQPVRPGPGDSGVGTGRRPGLRPGAMATAMGGDLDSEQLAVSGTAAPLRGGFSSNTRDDQLPGLSGLDQPPQRDRPGGMAERTDSVALHPEITMNTSLSTGGAEVPSADTYDVQPRQVDYVPKSKGFSTQTLIPFNMASAAQQALERFEQHQGDIDEYLATRLGYGSVSDLHSYFSAEQVDASALAISNIEQGAGFITGDQTGIGKGRICASIMRYAQQQGKIALFITKDKPLYADMMRDVGDIGMHRFTPFITDSGTEIPLANGASLKTAGAAKQQAEMQSQ